MKSWKVAALATGSLLVWAAMLGILFGAEPQVCPVEGCPPTATATLIPTKKTLEELGRAVDQAQVAVDVAVAAVDSAKTILAHAMAEQAGEQTKLDAARKALLDALNPTPTPPPNPTPTPTPTPPPPPTPTSGVSLLMVGRATGCPPCETMGAIVKEIAAAGYSASRVDVDIDPAAQAKWKPIVVPTLILIVDGKEEGRTTGIMSSAQSRSWLDAAKTWDANRKGGK